MRRQSGRGDRGTWGLGERARGRQGEGRERERLSEGAKGCPGMRDLEAGFELMEKNSGRR